MKSFKYLGAVVTGVTERHTDRKHSKYAADNKYFSTSERCSQVRNYKTIIIPRKDECVGEENPSKEIDGD